MRMHYSGGLMIRKGERVTTFARGFPVCCYANQAWAIRERGNQTNAVNMVTCKKCLRRLSEQQSDGSHE